MLKLVLLTPENIVEYWHLIKESIEDALKKGTGESSLFDIYKKLINGNAQAWVVLKDDKDMVAVATTEFIEWSQYKSLHLITVTGEGWDEYKYLHAELEQFAKDSGCKDVQVWGRKGWEKKLEKLDGKNGSKYKHTYSVFSMEV